MSLISTSIPINLYTTFFLIFWQQSYSSEICNCTHDSRSRHSTRAEAKVVLILLSNPAHSRVISPLLCPVLDIISGSSSAWTQPIQSLFGTTLVTMSGFLISLSTKSPNCIGSNPFYPENQHRTSVEKRNAISFSGNGKCTSKHLTIKKEISWS